MDGLISPATRANYSYIGQGNDWAVTDGAIALRLINQVLRLETGGKNQSDSAGDEARPQPNRFAPVTPINSTSDTNQNRCDSEGPSNSSLHTFSLHDVTVTAVVFLLAGLGLGALLGGAFLRWRT